MKKGYKILEGIRGEKAVNLDSISNILLKLSNLSKEINLLKIMATLVEYLDHSDSETIFSRPRNVRTIGYLSETPYDTLSQLIESYFLY